ncbi:MAG: hypothetical protein JO202_01650 [Ktedonobacteraceae bacterium]|nr:hypothetical protein [Ktedonobacteraceae bacterium]
MALSRLRRALRMTTHRSYQEAQALLDVVDQVHEDAQVFEEELRKKLELDEDALFYFVQRNAMCLVQALMESEAVGRDGVLAADGRLHTCHGSAHGVEEAQR